MRWDNAGNMPTQCLATSKHRVRAGHYWECQAPSRLHQQEASGSASEPWNLKRGLYAGNFKRKPHINGCVIWDQVKKDDAMKVLHSICQQIWKTQQWPQDWKRSVCIPIPKKGNAKECSNYHTIAFIAHASKVMLKILQARLQQYMNRELPDVQAGFRKGRGTRKQIANIRWIIEKLREFRKNINFCFIDYAKVFGRSQ